MIPPLPAALGYSLRHSTTGAESSSSAARDPAAELQALDAFREKLRRSIAARAEGDQVRKDEERVLASLEVHARRKTEALAVETSEPA